MKRLFKQLDRAALAVCLILAAAITSVVSIVAFAQSSYPIWTLPFTGNELIELQGVSAPGHVYITTKSLSNFQVNSYTLNTPVTGFSLTVGNNIAQLVLTPAGTLSTGTIVFPAAPVDGATLGINSTQTVSTLTLSASGTQTINNAVTTIGATSPVGYQYIASTNAWYRIQ